MCVDLWTFCRMKKVNEKHDKNLQIAEEMDAVQNKKSATQKQSPSAAMA